MSVKTYRLQIPSMGAISAEDAIGIAIGRWDLNSASERDALRDLDGFDGFEFQGDHGAREHLRLGQFPRVTSA